MKQIAEIRWVCPTCRNLRASERGQCNVYIGGVIVYCISCGPQIVRVSLSDAREWLDTHGFVLHGGDVRDAFADRFADDLDDVVCLCDTMIDVCADATV